MLSCKVSLILIIRWQLAESSLKEKSHSAEHIT